MASRFVVPSSNEGMSPGSAGEWSFVAPQRTPVHGGRDYPSVRYSAAAVQYKGELIVTHGYFYNHAIRHPAWQSNACARSPTRALLLPLFIRARLHRREKYRLRCAAGSSPQCDCNLVRHICPVLVLLFFFALWRGWKFVAPCRHKLHGGRLSQCHDALVSVPM